MQVEIIVHPTVEETMPMGKAIAGVMLAVCFVLLAGCAEEDQAATAEGKTETQAAPPGGGPTLSVEADKTHAVQPKDEITLTISVSGFKLDSSKIGQADESGVGHYRVYLDEASGDDYLAAGADTSTKVTVPGDITDGSHDLRVVLHGNDQRPLSPSVQAGVLLIVYRL